MAWLARDTCPYGVGCGDSHPVNVNVGFGAAVQHLISVVGGGGAAHPGHPGLEDGDVGLGRRRPAHLLGNVVLLDRRQPPLLVLQEEVLPAGGPAAGRSGRPPQRGTAAGTGWLQSRTRRAPRSPCRCPRSRGIGQAHAGTGRQGTRRARPSCRCRRTPEYILPEHHSRINPLTVPPRVEQEGPDRDDLLLEPGVDGDQCVGARATNPGVVALRGAGPGLPSPLGSTSGGCGGRGRRPTSATRRAARYRIGCKIASRGWVSHCSPR